ncbi:hypothetical protein BJV82DRAFT_270442 [Fennellomyces sp. T-0311]|nr:hypothetical protein BJV82DRAFT_270442 [Fennellomyces sp. T-0311]
MCSTTFASRSICGRAVNKSEKQYRGYRYHMFDVPSASPIVAPVLDIEFPRRIDENAFQGRQTWPWISQQGFQDTSAVHHFVQFVVMHLVIVRQRLQRHRSHLVDAAVQVIRYPDIRDELVGSVDLEALDAGEEFGQERLFGGRNNDGLGLVQRGCLRWPFVQ